MDMIWPSLPMDMIWPSLAPYNRRARPLYWPSCSSPDRPTGIQSSRSFSSLRSGGGNR